VLVERERAAEAVEVLGGQVDAAVAGVLADVAQDVRELERQAERVRQRRRGLLLGGREHPEDAE
jgi:hypothetical protein